MPTVAIVGVTGVKEADDYVLRLLTISNNTIDKIIVNQDNHNLEWIISNFLGPDDRLDEMNIGLACIDSRLDIKDGIIKLDWLIKYLNEHIDIVNRHCNYGNTISASMVLSNQVLIASIVTIAEAYRTDAITREVEIITV